MRPVSPSWTRAATLLSSACIALMPSSALTAAAEHPPYVEPHCVAAVVRAPAQSEHARLLQDSAQRASERLSKSLSVYQAVRDLEPGGDPQGLLDDLYWLTVRHWLEVKSQLCRCLGYEHASLSACDSVREEIDIACGLDPRKNSRTRPDLFCMKRGATK